MSAPTDAPAPAGASASGYRLEDQVGFVLRQVGQRHAVLFAAAFGDLTPTQWAALAKLAELGECSQNLLGRHVAMDVATVKGVVERLVRRGYAATLPDPADRRRLVVRPTAEGRAAYAAATDRARQVTADTLAPLDPDDRATFLDLLRRLR